MSYICKHCGEPGTEQDPVRLEGYGNSLFHPRCIEEARKDREGFEQRWAESQANVKAVPDAMRENVQHKFVMHDRGAACICGWEVGVPEAFDTPNDAYLAHLPSSWENGPELVEHLHQTDQGWLCPDSGHFVVSGHFLDRGCEFSKAEHRPAIRVFLIYAERQSA